MERFLKYGSSSHTKEHLQYHADQFADWLTERHPDGVTRLLSLLEHAKREHVLVAQGLAVKESTYSDTCIEPFVDFYLSSKEERKRAGKPDIYQKHCPIEEHRKLRATLDIPEPANINPWDFKPIGC